MVGRADRERCAWPFVLGALALVGLPRGPGIAGDDGAGIQRPGQELAAERFFEAEVRPLLLDHCVKCHGPEQQKGGLRLDSREAIAVGGDSGPVVDPGHPAASLLIEAIHYDGLKMPPTGQLDDAKIRTLERWVEQGAHWPALADGHGTAGQEGRNNQSAGRLNPDGWWAIRPLVRPPIPTPRDVGPMLNPIDAFWLAKLAEHDIEPAPEADRRVLIRRLSFDLLGLPPSPDDVDRFVNDTSHDAYERLVDRMLSSPLYGQRWARHWLDLVRYAESDGYRQDAYRPEAWRYRDYVIDAFNRDLSYDQFVLEQLAGDELDPSNVRLRTATSFLRLGTYEFNQRDVAGQRASILADLTDLVGDVFLGVGLGCARCHDHKFDPIPQTDYYRLQAFFAATIARDDLPLATEMEVADHAVSMAKWELVTADLRDQIEAIERPYRAASRADALAKFQPHHQAILAKPEAERTPEERQLAYFMKRQLIEEFGRVDDRIKGKEKTLHSALLKQLAGYEAIKPPPLAYALTTTDVGREAPSTTIPGDRSGQDVAPGFLSVLNPGPAAIETPASPASSTGRRLTLARWLARSDHPLVPRVLANRIWQYHFGKGLCDTPSDFGSLGDQPSHPELLDWLAVELGERNGSWKDLHRLIVTSRAYRQHAARRDAAAIASRIDPDNRLIWQRTPARLEAEAIRDAMLAAGGELVLSRGGPPAAWNAPKRTIMCRVERNRIDPLLAAFDAPDGSTSTPTRNHTTTATQSLHLLNGNWTLERAQALAQRIRSVCSDDPEQQVLHAYTWALGRLPAPVEVAAARSFLSEQGKERDANSALLDFCHALLNSNAFLYVD